MTARKKFHKLELTLHTNILVTEKEAAKMARNCYHGEAYDNIWRRRKGSDEYADVVLRIGTIRAR